MSENLDYEAWRCASEKEGENLFCPPEGCPKGFCARNNGWSPGMDSPPECLGFRVAEGWVDSPGAESH